MKNRLKGFRTGQPWTQDILADRSDVSRRMVDAIENGGFTPDVPIAFRIARCNGVAADEVFERDDGLPSADLRAIGRFDEPLNPRRLEGWIAQLRPPVAGLGRYLETKARESA